MIGVPVGNTVQNVVISGHAMEGFSITTIDGKPLFLAAVDENGHLVEWGPAVSAEAWNVAIDTYENFRRGQGHLRVYHKPPLEPIV